MKKWCKIIEILDNQVLFYMEPESLDKEKRECLHQVVRIRELCADIKILNIPPEDCEKVFESTDEEAAKRVIKTVEDLLEDEE
jgi:hypothetical protein